MLCKSEKTREKRNVKGIEPSERTRWWVKEEDHLYGAFAYISLPVTGYWLLGSQVNAGIRFCANNLTVGYLDFN